MLDFSLNLIIFISLAIITLLLGRGLERLDRLSIEANGKIDVFERISKKLQLAKVDVFLNKIFERNLRLLRVLALKTDSLTHKRLTKIINQKKGNGHSEIIDDNKANNQSQQIKTPLT